jgi:gluconolactonase
MLAQQSTPIMKMLMLRAIFSGALFLVPALGDLQAAKVAPAGTTVGAVQSLDPEFDRLVSSDAKIEVLAKGLGWAEGPLWLTRSNQLLFTDVRTKQVHTWQEGQPIKKFFVFPAEVRKQFKSAFAIDGLTLDAAGRFILAGHSARMILRVETNLDVTILADTFKGKRLNSPNDLYYKSNGDLYFTDPPYGLKSATVVAPEQPKQAASDHPEFLRCWRKDNSPDKELDFNGVYRLAPDGTLTLLIRDLVWPNGIAFSPDEKTLYVAVADPSSPRWMAYPVKDDGTLRRGRVFFDAKPFSRREKGLPNGIAVDQAGNLFAVGPGGVYVFSPDAKHLGIIRLGHHTTNCGWGEDGATLFITADHFLCRVRTKTVGLGF